MTNLPSKISEIVKGLLPDLIPPVSEQAVNQYKQVRQDYVNQLLALFQEEMGKIIGEDEDATHSWGNGDRNELRHSQRSQLAKVMKGK